jgi:hypothetical protein
VSQARYDQSSASQTAQEEIDTDDILTELAQSLNENAMQAAA